MSDLERRSGSRLTRQQRVDRAYKLTLATGGFGGAAAVLLVLAIVGISIPVLSGLIPLLLVLAVVSGLLLRRTMRG